MSYRRRASDGTRAPCIGPLASNVDGRDARSGAPVEMMQFDETGQAAAFLADALKSLRSREAVYGSFGRSYRQRCKLILQRSKTAEVPDLRRVHGQEFDFTPGLM